MNIKNRQLGFNLIEMMIVMVIVGILASIAVPSYSTFVTSSRRADGMSELTRVMQRQEKYFINRLSYATDLTELGLTVSDGKVESEDGYYLVEASACSGSTIARCVELKAVPTGSQSDDGWLSLNSRSERNWEKNAASVMGWP